MAILLLAPFSPDVLHVNYFCTKTITDQKANLLQIKNQIYHRSKIKSITDQKPNLSQIKTKSITDQKPNLSQTKHQIYHRSKTKSMTDQKPNLWQIKNQIYYRSKPNLSPIKTKSITDQKPNLLQIKNKIYYRSDKEILTTLVSVCWSNILWLNLSRRNVKVTLTRKYPIQVDTSLYSAVLNYVYTLRLIGPISYLGACYIRTRR